MATQGKGIFIFPHEFFSRNQDDSKTRVQENPMTSVVKKESRLLLQQILTVITMAAIVSVIGIGGYIKQTQYSDVKAGFDFTHSVTGMVLSTSAKDNTIRIRFDSSHDPVVNTSHKPVWVVSMPPGSSIQKEQYVQVCYRVELFSSLYNAQKVPCSAILSPGSPILIEYLIADPVRGTMVAKTIISQVK